MAPLRALALYALLLAFCGTAGLAQAQTDDGAGASEEVDERPTIWPGSAEQTRKKAVWGTAKHIGRSLFPYYRDLGVGIYETQARWELIAPTGPPERPTDPEDPAYRWPHGLDEEIAEAERYGMEVTLQLIGTPPWANGGKEWQWAAADPIDFRDFATAIARRYPSVDLWMVWGEPNRKGNFRPFTGAKPGARKLNREQREAPETYARLVDAAYEGLKTVEPDNLVIGGNTYFSGGRTEIIRPFPWIRYMRLPDGSRPRMDMWGHNPYSYRKPDLDNPPSPKGRVDFSDLRRLTKALDRTFPRPRLPLFLSEFGIPTDQDSDFDFYVKPRTARKWVRAAFRIVRRWDRIHTLGWSVPVDTGRNPQGLLDTHLNPKAVYSAFKEG